MMEKTAYLIVSDLHKNYKSLTNRFDYRQEIDLVQEEMVTLGLGYKHRGYRVVLLLLGDVFHNSYQNVFNAINDANFFVLWKRSIGDIYSVIGNHELSYYDSNPFFTLVNKIESTKVQGIQSKVWQPVGNMPTIRVVDRLDDGEVHFYFNHFGTFVSKPHPEGVNVGLFHQEIVCKSILNAMTELLGPGIYANPIDFESSDLFTNYHYCFFGHMHKMYGTWLNDNGTYLCYLASLGRTNETEVSNNFLERMIPAVLVEDGKFKGIDENKFCLLPREDSVNEVIVAKTKENYKARKEKKSVREYVPIGDDPIANLKSAFVSTPFYWDILTGLIDSSVDAHGASLLKRINGGLNDYGRN